LASRELVAANPIGSDKQQAIWPEMTPDAWRQPGTVATDRGWQAWSFA